MVTSIKKSKKRLSEIFGLSKIIIEKTENLIQVTEKLKKGLLEELLTKGIGHKKFKKTELGEIPEDWEIHTELREYCNLKMEQGFYSSTAKYVEERTLIPIHSELPIIDEKIDFIHITSASYEKAILKLIKVEKMEISYLANSGAIGHCANM